VSEDPLAVYRRFLNDDRHVALARQLLAWSLEHCACQRGTSWHARNSFYAATFAIHCAPSDATWRELVCSGKFLVVFFSVDDGPRSELLLLAEQQAAGHPVHAGELGRLYRALLADLRAVVDTAHVKRGLATCCAAAVTEGTHDVQRMTFEQFLTLRRSTTAIDCFIDLWRGLRRLPVPHSENLVAQAAEAVCLANDLASLEKETQPGAQDTYEESNYILFVVARSGQEVEAAVADATNRYNSLVDALARAGSGQLPTLLRGIVDGNLRVCLALSATRYPGAARRLSRLSTTSAVGLYGKSTSTRRPTCTLYMPGSARE
jgi:hypothetical protein